MADIRETGPVGLKGLKGLNRQKDISEMSLEEQWKSINSIPRESYSSAPEENVGLAAMQAGYGNSKYDEGITSASQFEDIGDIRYANQPWYDTLANGLGKMLGTAGTTFVSSLVGLPYGLEQAIEQGRWSALWDNDVTQELAKADKWLEENMTNYRSQEQQNAPWYDSSNLFSMNFIADDVIKNMGFTLGAAASMAVGSGSLGLMSRSLGFVNQMGKGTKMASNVLSALFSATGEGMIEARQGVEERNKLEMQKLEDSFIPEKQALETAFNEIEKEYAANRGRNMVMGADGRMYDPAYERYMQQMSELSQRRNQLNDRMEAGRQQIIESGQDMGNTILLANQGLLTVGNLIQFGKTMTKGFDKARHAAEMSSKATKPFGVSAERVSSNIKDGYKIDGKNFGRTIAATKGILTEGSEEMNQQMIQSSSGAMYNEGDVNDYWKAKLNPEAYRETTKGLYTVGSILDRGFQESWGDLDQWEQFVIGGFTGMSGSYAPTKLFNQDKNYGAFDPRRYGEWSGGAANEIKDFNREYQQYSENIDDLNKILQSEDFPSRVSSLVGHTFLETQKEDAVNNDAMKAWKDADDKQTIHDIQAFLRAGKIDDLRAIYNEMGSNLSDEDVENIVKSTTKEISAEEDKQNYGKSIDEQIAQHQRRITELQSQAQDIADSQESLGVNERADYQAAVTPSLEKIFGKIDDEYSAIDRLNQQKEDYVGQKRYEGYYVDDKGNRISTNDEIREEVKHNADELNRKLDSYLDSIDQVNRDTKGALTKDQEDNLAYLHNLGKESLVRADKIISDKRKQMPSKFLMKTDKTPEQLTKEYASSDLVFSKDDNTRDGYVEVDTSLMDDRSFRNFFIGELLWGGNINPEFGETADEKAIREEEEKNLSPEEKKKKARERVSKKWKEALEKQKKDAEEQRDANGDLIAQYFVKNYLKDNNASQSEIQDALNDFFQDIVDASSLVSQAGEYDKTLREYMANPNKVDEDKAKEENKASKANQEQQAKNKFAGKDAKQMNQGIADGSISIDELDGFADADLSGVSDEDVKAAQEEAKKSREIRQQGASLKQHIQDNLGDNPSQEDINAASIAMNMVDDAVLNAEDPSDISIDTQELNQIPLDQIDPNASIDDVDALNQNVQGMLADAFNAMQEDQNAQEDIPEEVPSIDDVEAPSTGHDPVTKTPAEVKAPNVQAPSKAANNPIPKNPLTEGSINTIMQEVQKTYDKLSTNGTWRSTTTRHPYGSSTGTYHENIAKKQYGEDSKEYKRSKAIWEYLNSEGAFDRMENSSADRIKGGDVIHFMIKNFASEMYGKDFGDCTDEEKLYSLAIIMLNENGEVIGDLPLAQLEPSYRSGNPTQQVKDLLSLQNKAFNKYTGNYEMQGSNEAIVDGILHKEGADNLNLTFDDGKKSPLVSKVKQVMRGAVPFRTGEKNTLNDVANGAPLQLGVKVTGSTVAIKRGDKNPHKEIVIPNVGSVGQPYLLLPTPSGEQMAIPFYMVPFNAEQHRNTELYKLLSNAVYHILANNNNSAAGKEAFKKHMDVIKGLLQVEAQENTRVFDVNANTVTLHLQSLTDASIKYDISIPYSSNYAELAKAIVDKLSGIPINVSLQYLNSSIETGIASNEKYVRNYNQVIGEVADINLPKATNHTVNGWFTVELAPSSGIKPSKKVQTRITGKFTDIVNGRTIEFNTDNLTAVDVSTGEIIVDNANIDLMLAKIEAGKPIHKGKERIQVSINGQLRTYDVKENKFVKNAPIKKETTATQQSAAEETPDISAVTPSTSGAISFAEQKENIIIPKDTTGFGHDNVSQGFIKNKHGIWVPVVANMYYGYILEDGSTVVGGSLTKAESLLERGNIIIQDGAGGFVEVSADNVVGLTHNGKDITEEIQKQVTSFNKQATQAKTLEQIESEMKQKKVVGRQTKDAWAAIPDDLKLRMVNEGAVIQLQYNNKNTTISMANIGQMAEVLKEANMAAKGGKLEVSEAVKPMKKEGVTLSREKEREARQWLAKNLPSLSSEERTQFVDKIAREGDNAAKMWGSYRAGVIEIQRNAPMGTVYHEAFHYVLDMILNEGQRRDILEIAKDEYGVTDDWTAEERLANDFRRYSMDENATGFSGRLRRWFRAIRDKIMRYNRISDATINQLFWKINNGEMAQKSVEVESFEENQQRVLMEIRNVQKEKLSWDNLPTDTRNALESSGLSKATYEQMSLEEKDQYVKCRG